MRSPELEQRRGWRHRPLQVAAWIRVRRRAGTFHPFGGRIVHPAQWASNCVLRNLRFPYCQVNCFHLLMLPFWSKNAVT